MRAISAYTLTDKAYRQLDTLHLPISGVEEFVVCRFKLQAMLLVWSNEYEKCDPAHPNPASFHCLSMSVLRDILSLLAQKKKLFEALKSRKSLISTCEYLAKAKAAVARIGDERLVAAFNNAFPLLGNYPLLPGDRGVYESDVIPVETPE